jgi:hypothetical protein
MAPKKKLKGKLTVMAPAPCGATTMDNVPNLLKGVAQFVDATYALRHKTIGDPLVMASPVLHGGTFKTIAQRAWEDPADLILKSFEMCKASGIIDESCTVDEFGEQFLRVKVCVFIKHGCCRVNMILDADYML